MALGIFSSRDSKAQTDNRSTSSNEETVIKPEKSYDAEAGLGRIEDPSRRDVDEGDSITIGKQIEMEAENAIKYRTCSWPKVRQFSPNQELQDAGLTHSTDCRLALL